MEHKNILILVNFMLNINPFSTAVHINHHFTNINDCFVSDIVIGNLVVFTSMQTILQYHSNVISQYTTVAVGKTVSSLITVVLISWYSCSIMQQHCEFGLFYCHKSSV